MTLRITNTTSGEVDHAIRTQRHRVGATATGMVLTLVIIADERNQLEATRAAAYSAGQHPCRILVVIALPGQGEPRLDAEITVGDRDGPGETIKLRLHGPLAHHQASVVLPLLLPDTPVVAWWPANPPDIVADDQLGKLAQRRITDAAAAKAPLDALTARAASYRAGDTDLAWTRLTPWRSMLATALDLPFDPIESAQVSAPKGNPSGPLLAAWLRGRLHVPITLRNSRGPGITGITLVTTGGDIWLTRPDGHTAQLRRPGTPARQIPLPRRDLRDLVTEELRLLDADEIYEQALRHLDSPGLVRLEQEPSAKKKKPPVQRKKAAS